MLNLSRSREQSIFVGMSALERAGVLAAILFMAAFVLAYHLVGGRTGLIAVHAAFLVYLATLALPFLLYRRDWGWFHPLVFTILWFELFRGTLPRLGLYATGLTGHRALSDWSSKQLDALLVEVLLLQAVGVLSLYAGFFLLRRVKTPRLHFPDPRAAFPKMLLIALASGVALVVLIGHAGGLGGLILQRGLPAQERVASRIGGHWHLAAVLLRTACLVWLALRPEMWRTARFWTLFVLSLVIGFAATGSRSDVVVPVVIALAIWCLHLRRIPYGRGLILAVLGLGAIGVLGEFRSATRGAVALHEVEVESTFTEGVARGLETMISYSTEIAGTYAILGRVPEEVDHLFGESYLSVLTAPIPRALWSGKPRGAGKLTAERVFGNRGGLGIPPGTIGEAYWNFSVPGVVLLYFLWGMFLRWLSCLFSNNPRDRGVLLFFVLSIFLFQPNTVSIFNYLLALAPALLVLVFLTGLPRFSLERSGVRPALSEA